MQMNWDGNEDKHRIEEIKGEKKGNGRKGNMDVNRQ